MAFYQRPLTPAERFRDFIKFQEELRNVAAEEGLSEEESLWFLLLWQLSWIADNISCIN